MTARQILTLCFLAAALGASPALAAIPTLTVTMRLSVR
jgi:hypothetical protein